MITYPAIPLPNTDFTGDVKVPVVRTGVTNGIVTQGARYSARVKTYGASWTLTTEEFVVFEEWFSETLVGGVLVFGMAGVGDGTISTQPFRFVGGVYQATKTAGLFYNVTATLESLLPGNAPTNRVPPVAPWLRLVIDPIPDQNLSYSHRNALLTSRPAPGDTRTLRIYPPIDATQYIYFGIRPRNDGDTLITSEDVDPVPPEPVYPFPDLPQVNAGLVDSGERRVARLDMDGGHSRQWVEWDTTRKVYSASWVFTLAELKTFQDFYFVSLKSGTNPFTMVLPIEGLFAQVDVQFIAGTYKEGYVEGDYWTITAQLERVVDQTVTPSLVVPYGRYYTPNITVTENRKVVASDAGKNFVFTHASGTINLHIGVLDIEFGILIKGLGSVLITRAPYTHNVSGLSDGADGSFTKASFELRDTIRPIGTLDTDNAGGVFSPLAFELRSVFRDIGTVPNDTADSSLSPASFELLTVLEDIGTLATDNAGSAMSPMVFELINFP